MEEILKLYRELCDLVGENDYGTGCYRPIHRAIQETIDQIPSDTRIAIRPAGYDTKKLLELYDFSEKNIIGIVNQKNRGDDFCGYPCFTVDTFHPEMCDSVIVCSFQHHQEISEELEKLHVPYIDIYSELEKRGVYLSFPHHFYGDHTHLEVNYSYLRYLRSEAGTQRQIALRELLQAAVECQDFVLISNIYKDCGGENGEYPLLKAVWEKSKQLLGCIQNRIRERKQKDIVLFWTDSIPYEMLHCLPRTMELSKQGTFFQRAYTHTPYTNLTMLAMFCNMLPIDDFPENQETITDRNSPLIRFVESKGYKVRVISDPEARPMGEEHLVEAGDYLPCGAKWWKGIVDLLQSPEPCFYIFHFLDSHGPCFVSDLKDPVEFEEGIVTEMRQEVQIKAALEYLDQCLLLYHKLLGNKIQVFFSDHGNHWFEWDKPWAEYLLHPYCFAVGENIPKITVTRFFPYGNFEKFARWLVEPEHFSLDDACADEVIFQDTDFRSPEYIDRFIRLGNPKWGITYRGVLNYDCKYAINALGEEYFYEIQQDGSEKLVPLEDSALRDELRSKAGTGFLDIDQHDEFRYAKKLYDAIKSNES